MLHTAPDTIAPGAAPPPAGEALVEYRQFHCAARSEASTYFTNTPAQVEFRFGNPILCGMTAGRKIMRLDGGPAFAFDPGDAMFVPAGTRISVDLGAARRDRPIACDCIEIEAAQLEQVVERVAAAFAGGAGRAVLGLSHGARSVLRGEEAHGLGLAGLMELFRARRDVYSDLRIEARLADTLLGLFQARNRELLVLDEAGIDGGVAAAVRLLRANLDRRVSMEELAAAARMSDSSLLRHFRRLYGTSPARFAARLRVEAAKQALRGGDEPVEELAFRLGFSDGSHLCRVFRKQTGETPAEYRRRRSLPPPPA